MQKWEFSQTWDRCWYWHRTNDEGTVVASARFFETRIACVADAFGHGYMWPQTREANPRESAVQKVAA